MTVKHTSQALATADRRESKGGKSSQRTQRKKATKVLWVTEKGK